MSRVERDPLPLDLGDITQALPAHPGTMQIMPLFQQGVESLALPGAY